MSDWGLNPATVQALGAVATTLALLGVVASVWYARRTSQEAKRSADAATDFTVFDVFGLLSSLPAFEATAFEVFSFRAIWILQTC